MRSREEGRPSPRPIQWSHKDGGDVGCCGFVWSMPAGLDVYGSRETMNACLAAFIQCPPTFIIIIKFKIISFTCIIYFIPFSSCPWVISQPGLQCMGTEEDHLKESAADVGPSLFRLKNSNSAAIQLVSHGMGGVGKIFE